MRHEKLRERMQERGISQGQLAKIVGMDRAYLCIKLSGKRQFRWREVFAICRVLEIENPIGYFEP